ncbi:glycosyltransferase family 39 protein [Leptolyngbya ohadii]|uniref:glycosyltransferase family 39 protein n=1 Tax=Leptolyngbya ohadii TaxID=1962290 RepID=UPI00117B233C|nr:glycosyltransferase family 39 protein [Leptolyngbya ohadii]
MKPKPSIKWLKVIFLIVLLLGALFRFFNLDQKPYWQDETYTSLRVSGYSYSEAVQALYTGKVIGSEDIQKYQQWSSEKTVADTIHGLATENSQHPPLYYAIAHGWAGWFGSSISAMRMLPALISLLVFPAMYWLCLELFGSSAVGWLAVSLAAVSPIYLRYAQEARQYSLWMVIILLSSATLMRAIRLQTARNWSLYGLTLIAGLYCHILFILLILAHGFYVIAIERFRLNKTVIRYLLVASAAIATFIPWLQTIWQHRETVEATTGWISEPLSFLSLVKAWGINICQLFVAWHFRYDDILVYLAIPISSLIVAAVYTTCRQAVKPVWLFIVLLMSVTALPLVVPDLVSAGRISINPRYFLPSYLGMNLAVAYFLTNSFSYKFTQVSIKYQHFISAALITSSIIICAIAVHASTWWGWSEFDVDIARIINRSSNPLVISDMPLGVILPISHRLHPETRYLLLTEPESLTLPEQSNPVFVYNPTDRLITAIQQQNIQPEIVYQFQDDTFIFSLYQLQK